MSSTSTDTLHQHLNPERQITPGEWLELAALHDQHGPDLLIWQARRRRWHTIDRDGRRARRGLNVLRPLACHQRRLRP